MADFFSLNPITGEFQKTSSSSDRLSTIPSGSYQMRTGDLSAAITVLNLFTNQIERVSSVVLEDYYVDDGADVYVDESANYYID